ncbi:hypothetical protein [Verrucomicrobium sp. BvORR106]|uniref:hypothetical protein n=1 Tax=Verrucomicrobium sp. BvORR106 TaxID=1403819 RepID=UPI00057171D4|nr:hypothetical protein [Verrucomicrobium sp. BvORR106]
MFPTNCLANLVLIALAGVALAQPVSAPPVTCEDSLVAKVAMAPKLDSAFYHQSQSSYHWWIVENEEGNLEDTADGEIDADDLLKLEHTANVVSTHQGEHLMGFCEVTATTDGAVLIFAGGMPAYASSLTVELDAKRNFKCSFAATYPGPTNPLRWKITKKELKLKSPTLTGGTRLYGWISVTFDEIDTVTGASKSHKIEGYFKPVVQHKKP